MKAITAVLVVVVLCAAAAPGLAQGEYTENFSRTVKLGSSGSFELSNVSGDVVITGGGGNEARIQAVKRVRDRDEATARAALQELQIQVTERAGGVQVRTELPSRRKPSAAAVDFTVAVPAGASVNLKTVSGDIRVSNVTGELRSETVSGDVNVASAARLRAVSSVSGDITLTDSEADDVVGHLVSGDFTARNLKARSIELRTVSGDLRFTDTQSDMARLQTVSGDIDYAGRLARNGRYEFESHSGDVRLTPTGTVAFDLEANTFSGHLRSDFTLTASGGTTGAALTAGSRRGGTRTLRGAVGGGGPLVTIRTFSGDATIIKR